MAWVYLFFAGLLEIGWAIGLKASHGFSRPLPSTLTVIAMVASFWLLALAMRTLPMATAYAVWTGIGAVGTVALGMLFFQDSASTGKLLSLLMIVAGIIGVKLFS